MQYMKLFSWVPSGPHCPSGPPAGSVGENPTKKAEKPVKKGVFGLFMILICKRRARDSNPQPLTGHHISSVAASHSLTLQIAP